MSCVNFFNFRTEGYGVKNSAGPFGLSAGLEYGYSPVYSMALTVGAATDNLLTASEFLNGESFSSIYATLVHQTRIHEYVLAGAGLSYGLNIFSQWDNSTRNGRLSERYGTLGLAFTAYYTINRYFMLGVVYRTSYYRFGMTAPWSYEHVISFDLLLNLKW
ncbi:MAG: hypothetical protein LBF19_00370 [Prevotellaceae bacterium]|jgi:outer membrane protein assembly factor BamA|nr:hypothetical protein [Prevotellaceae bacterium]